MSPYRFVIVSLLVASAQAVAQQPIDSAYSARIRELTPVDTRSVGRGHVVLFGIRPLWRWESQGSFALALNAIANWNHLDLQ